MTGTVGGATIRAAILAKHPKPRIGISQIRGIELAMVVERVVGKRWRGIVWMWMLGKGAVYAGALRGFVVMIWR